MAHQLRRLAMNDFNTSTEKVTIGLDISDRYCHFCVVDPCGDTVEEGRLRTTPQAIGRHFSNHEPVRVVLETGTHSPWVSRLLEESGHEVFVANPRKLRLIYENDTKSDRVDAEYLARVGRLDPKLLAPMQHRGADTQADLAIIRSRDALIQARTQLVNHVRGSVKAFGGRLPKCSTHSFAQTVRDDIPQELRPALMSILRTISILSRQIKAYDRHIEKIARAKYPETELLRQVSGVGPLTALAYMLTLEDPYRFPKSRAVGSYLGLRPRQGESGTKQPQLHITKAGDRMLRRLLVGSAHYIMGPFGPDTDLRRWGLMLASRGGKNAKKRAAVAVARKLSVLLHRLWITAEVYEPLQNTQKKVRIAA